MIVLVLLLLIAIVIFQYIIFTEIERILDNTFEIGNKIQSIDKTLVRIRKGKK